MDSYCEQLVAKTRTSGDVAKAIMTIAASLLIAAGFVFLMMLIGLLALILAFASIALGVWLVSGMSVEYEYIVTNDEMDIDKIKGRRKRTRMITVDIKRTFDFEPVPCRSEEFDVAVHASSGLEDDAYCLFVEHPDYGKVKIIFNPNKKIRDAIAQNVPKQLRKKVVGEDVE